jgi:hypothetical protein
MMIRRGWQQKDPPEEPLLRTHTNTRPFFPSFCQCKQHGISNNNPALKSPLWLETINLCHRLWAVQQQSVDRAGGKDNTSVVRFANQSCKWDLQFKNVACKRHESTTINRCTYHLGGCTDGGRGDQLVVAEKSHSGEILPGITVELLRIPEFVRNFQNPKLAKRADTPTRIPECDVTLRQGMKQNSAGIPTGTESPRSFQRSEVWDRNKKRNGKHRLK